MISVRHFEGVIFHLEIKGTVKVFSPKCGEAEGVMKEEAKQLPAVDGDSSKSHFSHLIKKDQLKKTI